MEINLIKEMLAMGEIIGTVKKVNMYNENTIYIEGETADGKSFNLDLRLEEEE